MKGKILFWIITLCLVNLITANAFEPSPICSGVEAYDFSKLTKCQTDTELIKENTAMAYKNEFMIDEVVKGTTGKIEAEKSYDLLNFFRIIFSALFVLITTLTGYKFITSAAYPEKRTEAKRQLSNIIIIGILIVALPWIISESISISSSLSDSINMQMIDQNYFKLESFQDTTDNLERFSRLSSTSPLFVTAAESYLISMHARELILLFLICISPLVLLLFYFLPTQEYGKLAVYLFFIELFVPVIYVVVFKFASISNVTETGKMITLTAALFFNVFMHILLILMSMLKAVLAVIRDIGGGRA